MLSYLFWLKLTIYYKFSAGIVVAISETVQHKVLFTRRGIIKIKNLKGENKNGKNNWN